MPELIIGISELLNPSPFPSDPSAGPMGYLIFIGFLFRCYSEREGNQWRQYLCSSDISCSIVVAGGLNEMQFPPAKEKKRVRQRRRESVNNGVDRSPFFPAVHSSPTLPIPFSAPVFSLIVYPLSSVRLSVSACVAALALCVHSCMNLCV